MHLIVDENPPIEASSIHYLLQGGYYIECMFLNVRVMEIRLKAETAKALAKNRQTAFIPDAYSQNRVRF